MAAIDYPKISIVTVTFNCEKTIEETIQSILSQNYPNLEYLIIDGKSTDSTMSIVEKYSDRISRIVSEKDNGISDAFNKGVRLSSGDIVGIINGDDVLLPGALDALAKAYDPEVDVYRGNIMVWNDQTDNRIRVVPTMDINLRKVVWNVCHQSTFVARKCYDRFGLFNESFKYMMDADLLHRFYLGGAKFKYVDYDMALFRLGGVTKSSFKKKIPELKAVIRANGGSGLLVAYRVVMFYCYHTAKSLVQKILGGDRAREMRY